MKVHACPRKEPCGARSFIPNGPSQLLFLHPKTVFASVSCVSNYLLPRGAHHIQSSTLTHWSSLKCIPCVHNMSSFIRLAHRSEAIQKSRMALNQGCQLTLSWNWIPLLVRGWKLKSKVDTNDYFSSLTPF